MSIDVIVATYNRPDRLKRCLDGLARQTTDGFAVIVVDDSSDTPVLEPYPGDYPFPIRVLRTARNSGPAHARNLGAANSVAEYLAFVDDDVVASPRLLECHVRAMRREGDACVVIGPLRAPPDWDATPWNRWEADTLAVEYRRMMRGDYEPTWRQFFTGNAFVRRETFLAAGGFDERFTRAEDIELGWRMASRGMKFVFEPEAVGWHYAERTLASWRNAARQYAQFDRQIDALHPELEWMRHLQREHQGHHPGTLAVRALAARLGIETAIAAGAIAAGRALHAARIRVLNKPLFSLAFQLEYAHAQRAVANGQVFNNASTDAR